MRARMRTMTFNDDMTVMTQFNNFVAYQYCTSHRYFGFTDCVY